MRNLNTKSTAHWRKTVRFGVLLMALALNSLHIAYAQPLITYDQPTVTFGAVPINGSSETKKITVTNTGDVFLALNSFTFTNGNASYNVFAGSCSSTLNVGASCDIEVSLSPGTLGSKTDIIRVLTTPATLNPGVNLDATATAACQFTGLTGGFWNVPANWSNCATGDGTVAGTPGPSNRAEITVKTVELANGITTVGDLYLGAAVLLGNVSTNSQLRLTRAGGIAWASGDNTFQRLLVDVKGQVNMVNIVGKLTLDNATFRSASVTGDDRVQFLSNPALEIINAGAFVNGRRAFLSGDLVLQSGGSVNMTTSGSISLPNSITITTNGNTFTNGGVIVVDAPNVLTIVGAASFVTGSGGGYGGSGTITAAAPQVFTVTGGTIEGSLTFNVGTLSLFDASISGSSIVNLTVNGNLTLGGNSYLPFLVSGPTVFSTLMVNGDLSFNGPSPATTVAFDNVTPYAPAFNTAFNVMTYTGTLTGTASNITNLGSTTFNANYATPNVIKAIVVAATSITPTSQTYPNTQYGSFASQTFTVTNNSGVASTAGNTSIAFTGTNPSDFAVFQDNCTGIVANGATCTIVIHFLPATHPVGAKDANFTITINSQSAVATLSGTTTSPTGGFLAPESFDPIGVVGPTPVGTTTSTNVTFYNVGNSALNIVSSTVPPPFTLDASNCNGVAAGASCNVIVSVTPTAVGPLNALFSVTSNFNVVNLTATAIGTATLAPTVVTTLMPTTIPLGGTSTATLTIANPNASTTLTNVNITSLLNVFQLQVAPPANVVSTCSFPEATAFPGATTASISIPSLAPLTSCTFSYDFKATNTTGVWPIVTDLISSTEASATPTMGTVFVTVTAAGVAPMITTGPAYPGGISGTPYSIFFDASGSPASTWTVLSGTPPPGLTLTGASGVFSGTPTAAGTYNFTIQAANGTMPNATQMVSIFISPPALTFAPASLTFGNTSLGTASVRQLVTLTNTTGAAIAISMTTNTPGQFGHYIPSCGTSIPAMSSSCTIEVDFAPNTMSALTSFNGSLNINTPSGNLVVPLTGNSAVAYNVTNSGNLAYPPTVAGQNSTNQTVTYTNSGTGTANVLSVSIDGADPNEFVLISNTCTPGTFNPSATCTATVRFSPTTAGAKTANIRLTHATTNNDSVTLSGTATAGLVESMTVAFNPTTVAVNTPTNMTLTLTNPTANPIFIGSGSVTAPAGLILTAPMSNTCGTFGSVSGQTYSFGMGFIPTMGSCTIILTAQSATATSYTVNIAAGALNGTNTNTSSAMLNVIPLSPPTITFVTAPTSIVVNGTAVGTLTVNNPNASPLTGSAFTFNYLPGLVNAPMPNATSSCVGATPSATPNVGFSATTTSFTIPASGSCTFSVTITSATAAVYSGNISAGLIMTPAGGSNTTPFSLTVTAATVAPLITSAPALPGGTVNTPYSTTFIASGNPASTWTLTTGTLPLGLNLTGATGVLNGTPTMAGTFAFTIQAANGTMPNATQAVSIIIAASGATPTIVSAAPPAGLTGQAYSFTPTATGSTPFNWAIFGALPLGLTFNNLTGAITGTPTLAGTSTFTLTVTNIAGTANQLTSITITTPIIPAISVSPASLNFGLQNLGTVSPAQAVSVSNTGNGSFNINSITSVGDYAYTSNCPATLAPFASCSLSFTFSPLESGIRNGIASVNTTSLAGSGSISLSGTGVSVPRANIIINPSGGLNFGNQAQGTVSAPQIVFISNTGLATLELRNISLSAGSSSGSGSTTTTPSFTLGAPPAADNPNNLPSCGGTLAPGTSCALGVSFAPATSSSTPPAPPNNLGTQSATITITHNATLTGIEGTSSIGLSGNATARREAIIRLSASGTSFADQVLATVSTPQTISVTNAGTIDLTIGALSISPSNANTSASDFQVSSGCGTLIPNANCQVSLSFSPTGAIGSKAATLNIASNASAGITSLSLNGTAIAIPAPVVRLSATSLGFGTAIMGGASSSQALTLTNAGGLPLRIASISVDGGEFAQTNNCPIPTALLPTPVLNAMQSCTINITFTPQGLSSRGASLTITSNATPATNTVPLSGVGCRFLTAQQQRLFVTNCGN